MSIKKNAVWRYSNECTADETDRPNPLLYRNANERPFSLTLPVDSAARAIRTDTYKRNDSGQQQNLNEKIIELFKH